MRRIPADEDPPIAKAISDEPAADPILMRDHLVVEVRSDPEHRGIPILVLTTESDAEKKNRARMAGATGWIVKPFNPIKLVDAIRRVAA